MNYLIASVIGLSALTFFLTARQPSSPRSGGTAISNEEAPKVGYRAPNFRLPGLNGEEVGLVGLTGKVVFLNFWATWCGPCRAEMPSMEALYHDFKDKGLEILAVSSDMNGARDVQPFVKELGLTYPILLDPDFRVDDEYLIQSVPTTILVDRDGVITHRMVGARNWNTPESRDLIQKLLRAR